VAFANFVEITFKGPIDKADDAIEKMMGLGFVQAQEPCSKSELIAWREAFPGLTREEENAIVLQETRKLRGLTQKQLSELTDIPKKHISEMENRKRMIDKQSAKRFAQALGVKHQVFL